MNKQIKIFVAPTDHNRVRLAAALRRTTMADFCRQVVLAETERLTTGLSFNAEDKAIVVPTTRTQPRRSKSS